MSTDGVITTKSQILELLTELDESELDLIENWIVSRAYKEDLEFKRSLHNKEKELMKIGNVIKKIIPFEAEMPTENIVPPIVGDQSDCNNSNTCHVDEFLYDEDEVNELIKRGKLKRQYCLDCSSRNVTDLFLISHSMSRQTLLYIFKVMLPANLEGKQLLDLGSRIGGVLYGAYHFSNVSSIIGIEINKEFCEVQERVMSHFSMDTNRIKVVHSDVMDRNDIVVRSDIIIINVLDFFADVQKHKDIWYFLKKYLKKGTFVVTNRSMADTLGYLNIFEEFINWLTICKPKQIENEVFFDVENFSEMYLYLVK